MDNTTTSELSLVSSAKYRWSFIEPVTVTITTYDDDSHIYVEHDAWDIYGSGPSFDEAIEDWWLDFDEIYTDLRTMAAEDMGQRLIRIKTAIDAVTEQR